MGLLRSLIVGGLSYWISMLLWYDGLLAFWAGIIGFFFAERITHGAHKRKLVSQHKMLNQRLMQANSTIHNMNDQLIITQDQLVINGKKLGKAIDELERRDAVGSPATRELLKRQDETLAIQSLAINENAKSHERALEMFAVLERAVKSQGIQGNQLLQKMSEIVERLALEPRNTTVTMQDSVLVQGDEKNPQLPIRPSRINGSNSPVKANIDNYPVINIVDESNTALISPENDITEADRLKLNTLLQALL